MSQTKMDPDTAQDLSDSDTGSQEAPAAGSQVKNYTSLTSALDEDRRSISHADVNTNRNAD